MKEEKKINKEEKVESKRSSLPAPTILKLSKAERFDG